MLMLHAKTERLAYIAASMVRCKGRDLQVAYCERILRVMSDLGLVGLNAIPPRNDLIRSIVYINGYPVAGRYFKSILRDMVFMAVRYEDTVDPGRIQPDITQIFFDLLQANARAIDQDSGSLSPDSGAIALGATPEHAYF